MSWEKCLNLINLLYKPDFVKLEVSGKQFILVNFNQLKGYISKIFSTDKVKGI